LFSNNKRNALKITFSRGSDLERGSSHVSQCSYILGLISAIYSCIAALPHQAYLHLGPNYRSGRHVISTYVIVGEDVAAASLLVTIVDLLTLLCSFGANFICAPPRNRARNASRRFGTLRVVSARFVPFRRSSERREPSRRIAALRDSASPTANVS